MTIETFVLKLFFVDVDGLPECLISDAIFVAWAICLQAEITPAWKTDVPFICVLLNYTKYKMGRVITDLISLFNLS